MIILMMSSDDGKDERYYFLFSVFLYPNDNDDEIWDVCVYFFILLLTFSFLNQIISITTGNTFNSSMERNSFEWALIQHFFLLFFRLKYIYKMYVAVFVCTIKHMHTPFAPFTLYAVRVNELSYTQNIHMYAVHADCSTCCCTGDGDFFDKFNGCSSETIVERSTWPSSSASFWASWRAGDVDDIECGEDDVGDETSATRKLFRFVFEEKKKAQFTISTANDCGCVVRITTAIFGGYETNNNKPILTIDSAMTNHWLMHYLETVYAAWWL